VRFLRFPFNKIYDKFYLDSTEYVHAELSRCLLSDASDFHVACDSARFFQLKLSGSFGNINIATERHWPLDQFKRAFRMPIPDFHLKKRRDRKR
jgi:hypothetical protein